MIVQFGVPPNRVDLVGYVDGVSLVDCWEHRVVEELPGSGESFAVPCIGLQELIRNKHAVGRPQDQDDPRFLRRTGR